MAALFSDGCTGSYMCNVIYRKIPIISPRLIFAQKAVLLGLYYFQGELIIGGN